MKRLVLLFLIGFFSCLETQAQKDYLITLRGDTLYGLVQLLNYSNTETVQVFDGNKKQTFNPVQAREFRLENEIYRPLKNGDRYQFMKLIQDGFLGLYLYRVDRQMTYDGRFLHRRDGRYLDVPNIGFKKKMTDFLSECESVVEKINAGDLGRLQLELIVTEFNHCISNITATTVSNRNMIQEGPEIAAVNKLIDNISSGEDFPDKSDIMAMLNDIKAKLGRGEKIPGYLKEALKNSLSGKSLFEADLNNLLEKI